MNPFTNKRLPASLALFFFLWSAGTVFAQTDIKGTVTDATKQPISGATVSLKGGKQTVATDQQGGFAISVPANATLVFSYVGYTTREITVGDQAFLTVELQLSNENLTEVVVTALGIKKEKRAVGYATQTIKGADLVKAREPNGIGTLTGKVAGLRISNTPNLFGNPGISLRGVAPLIVVDGVPIASDSWNLSPDDIETYTVLKGPTASALYGSRGTNGAIEITTKRGTRNKKGFSIEFNSSNQLQTGFNALPKVQHSYGPGSAGIYAFGTGAPGGGGKNDYDYFIWGPKFNVPDPSTPSGYWETTQWDSEYDPNNTYTVRFGNGSTHTSNLKPKPWLNKGQNNLKNYLRNGFLSTNNIAVSTSSEKGDLRFSLSHTFQQGMVPNTDLNITNFNMSGGLNFSPKLRLEANLTYNRQYTKNYPNVAYGPNSFVYNMFIWGGSNYDIREMRDYWQPGKQGVQQKWVEYQQYNNPWLVAYEQLRGYYNDNGYGFMKLNYKFNNDVSAYIRSYVNFQSVSTQNRYPVSTNSYNPWFHVGGYEEQIANRFENNTDVLVTYNKKLSNAFSLRASAGGNLLTRLHKEVYGRTSGGLNVPGWYSLSNSKDPFSPTSYNDTKQVQSFYGYADLSFKNYLFLNLTGRQDKSSSLPLVKNSYFYNSASLSAVISDMVKLPRAISFLKLRASQASVGEDFDGTEDYVQYNYMAKYNTGTRWNGNQPLYYSGILYNPDSLLPTRTNSYEAGLEARFLDNRLGVDIAFFKTYKGPRLLNLPVSQASGYDSRQVSGGKTERRGWEITLTGAPVRKKDFSWDVIVNLASYRQYLRKIYGGQTVQDRFVSVGDRIDPYTTTVFDRSPDGQIVFGAGNGYRLTNPYSRQIGWILPDLTASIINSLRYKSLQLSFQFDGVLGGTVYDQTRDYLWSGGNHPNSVTKERDDEVLRGQATMVGDGVVVTGGAISYDGQGNVISDTRTFARNTKAAMYSEFARRFGTTGEMTAVDKTFSKLREVMITYSLPAPFIKRLKFFESANVSVVGRNLFYFSKVKDMDLDAISSESSGSGLQTPSVKSFGLNINLIF